MATEIVRSPSAGSIDTLFPSTLNLKDASRRELKEMTQALHEVFQDTFRTISYQTLQAEAQSTQQLDEDLFKPFHREIARVSNAFANFVWNEIVSCDNTKDSARVVHKFIHMAQSFKKSGNFAAYCSLVQALTNNGITRLNCDQYLSQKEVKWLTRQEKIISPNDNFGLLKKELKDQANACTPCVEVVLRDLVAIGVAQVQVVLNPVRNLQRQFGRSGYLQPSRVKDKLNEWKGSTHTEPQLNKHVYAQGDRLRGRTMGG